MPSNSHRRRRGSWQRQHARTRHGVSAQDALTEPDSAAASRLSPSSPQHGQDARLESNSAGAAATSPPSPPEPVRVGVAAPDLSSPLEPDFAATSGPSSPEPDFAGAAAISAHSPEPDFAGAAATSAPSPEPDFAEVLVLPSPPPPPSVVPNRPPESVDQPRFKLLSLLDCAEGVPYASDSSGRYVY
jgi:hypothetical protein